MTIVDNTNNGHAHEIYIAIAGPSIYHRRKKYCGRHAYTIYVLFGMGKPFLHQASFIWILRFQTRIHTNKNRNILYFDVINCWTFGSVCKMSLTQRGSINPSWWNHDIETRTALLVLCEGSPSVPTWYHWKRTSNSKLWCFFFCWSLNKILNKQMSYQWFETSWHSYGEVVMHFNFIDYTRKQHDHVHQI